jgi:uncharacterized protein YjbJ (UPF0337 family)
MDENRVSGTARNIGGKIEEGAGKLVGDTKTQIQGKIDQVSGAAQDLYGQAADTARETATGFEKWLRTTIETQPYRQPWPSASAGCSAGCIGRCSCGTRCSIQGLRWVSSTVGAFRRVQGIQVKGGRGKLVCDRCADRRRTERAPGRRARAWWAAANSGFPKDVE